MLPSLVLETITEHIPVITQRAAGFYIENCIVCFSKQEHRSGVRLTVDFEEPQQEFIISWTGEFTDELSRAYVDHIKFIDFGAVTIALLLVRELTEYTAIEQAAIGTTIDYWLTEQQSENDTELIFNQAARLEVSGILHETPDNSINGRVKDKLNRLIPNRTLPTFICVVDFSQPRSKIVKI